MIIFGLMQCGIHDLWSHLPCVGGYQKVTSLSHHQGHTWIDYVCNIITWLIYTLAFLTVSEKCKSTSLSAIQVKNWQTTISTEEKLDISQLEKGE